MEIFNSWRVTTFEVLDVQSVFLGTGADAMHELGERYFQIAEDRAGSETTKAMEWAKKSPDPEHQLLAAEHATMPEDPASAQRAATLAKKQGKPNAERLQARAAEIKAEAKPKEMVDPSKLVEGTVGTINNIPVRVEEGELRDHGELPDTPVEALRHPVPFDKGSRHVESGHDSDEGLEDAAGSFNPDEFELESRVSARAKQLTQEKGIKPVLALALAKREMMSKIPQRPQLKTERAA